MLTESVSPSVTVCSHPLLSHYLTILRDKNTSHAHFRMVMKKAATLVLVDAMRHLPLSSVEIETPLTKTTTYQLHHEAPILILPILRAGLLLAEVALDLLPEAYLYHIGLYRDEVTLSPVTYYNKLPDTIHNPQTRIFVLDPMLATGGSANAALDLLQQRGVQATNITFVCVVAAPEGIQALTMQHPEVNVVAGGVDESLNENGYILPGLGDAGDRAFGTLYEENLRIQGE